MSDGCRPKFRPGRRPLLSGIKGTWPIRKAATASFSRQPPCLSAKVPPGKPEACIAVGNNLPEPHSANFPEQ